MDLGVLLLLMAHEHGVMGGEGRLRVGVGVRVRVGVGVRVVVVGWRSGGILGIHCTGVNARI